MVFGLSKRHVASWLAMTIIAAWGLRQKGVQSREGLVAFDRLNTMRCTVRVGAGGGGWIVTVAVGVAIGAGGIVGTRPMDLDVYEKDGSPRG